MTDRVILHIDFDYFYAQVEEVERPETKGQPLVVCMFSGRTATSGAVATSNYEARNYGVKAGIPIFEAKAKLKGVDALFLPANHALYAEKSLAIMQLLAAHADAFEPASIDEAFLDVSQRCAGDFKKAETLAREIKKAIYSRFRLTCSIGIGPNKLVAKIASDFKKPDGLTAVPPARMQAFLDPLDVGDIPGVGKKTRDFLSTEGLRTVADLRQKDPGWILESFGKKTGAWLVAAAHGKDESEVGLAREQKQMSRIATLKRNTRDIGEIMRMLKPLAQDLQVELEASQQTFSTLGIQAIDENMQAHAKSRTLPHPSGSLTDMEKAVRELFVQLIRETTVEFRRVGVRVEKLQSRAGQKSLGEF